MLLRDLARIPEDADLRCGHMGKVKNKPSQDWVTIAGKRILVEDDPEGRDIDLCPFRNPAGLPLASTTYYFASLDDLVTAAVEKTGRDELADARAQLVDLAAGADAQEGIKSFFEKRAPAFPLKPSKDMPPFGPWSK